MNTSKPDSANVEIVYVTSSAGPNWMTSQVNAGLEKSRSDLATSMQRNRNDLIKAGVSEDTLRITSPEHKTKKFVHIPANGRPVGEHLTAAQLTAADREFLARPCPTTFESIVYRLRGKGPSERPVRQNRPSRKPADPLAKKDADMGAQADKFQREEAAAYKGAGWDPKNIDRAQARENEKHKSQVGTMKRLDESLAKALPSAKAKDMITMD